MVWIKIHLSNKEANQKWWKWAKTTNFHCTNDRRRQKPLKEMIKVIFIACNRSTHEHYNCMILFMILIRFGFDHAKCQISLIRIDQIDFLLAIRLIHNKRINKIIAIRLIHNKRINYFLLIHLIQRKRINDFEQCDSVRTESILILKEYLLCITVDRGH